MQGGWPSCRRRRETAIPEQHWQVEAAVLKLHSRRCTCLEFHPTRVRWHGGMACLVTMHHCLPVVPRFQLATR